VCNSWRWPGTDRGRRVALVLGCTFTDQIAREGGAAPERTPTEVRPVVEAVGRVGRREAAVQAPVGKPVGFSKPGVGSVLSIARRQERHGP